jgi:pimeloyl-ACP methyl ester carboxylesterase
VLHNHVAISEMYRPGQSAAALRRQFDQAVLSTGTELSYARLYQEWPRYPNPPRSPNVSEFQGPMLLLQGGLDTPSPVDPARRAAAAYGAPGQHLVIFPQGAHGVTGQTPTLDGTDCARQIYLAFIDRPQRTPDARCVARIRPLDWKWLPAGAKALAGTEDLWSD